MKTAISIPDGVFEEAEAVAQRLGMSRSSLYARALVEFLQARREANITEKLNEVYARESSALDPALERMQTHSLVDETW